ncbi:MAG: hypothetical protein J6U64_00920 [Alphaproteobacteria bacterium]|nr:hypothetical protein [Alphaproteobacteria bacterium]
MTCGTKCCGPNEECQKRWAEKIYECVCPSDKEVCGEECCTACNVSGTGCCEEENLCGNKCYNDDQECTGGGNALV